MAIHIDVSAPLPAEFVLEDEPGTVFYNGKGTFGDELCSYTDLARVLPTLDVTEYPNDFYKQFAALIGKQLTPSQIIEMGISCDGHKYQFENGVQVYWGRSQWDSQQIEPSVRYNMVVGVAAKQARGPLVVQDSKSDIIQVFTDKAVFSVDEKGRVVLLPARKDESGAWFVPEEAVAPKNFYDRELDMEDLYELNVQVLADGSYFFANGVIVSPDLDVCGEGVWQAASKKGRHFVNMVNKLVAEENWDGSVSVYTKKGFFLVRKDGSISLERTNWA